MLYVFCAFFSNILLYYFLGEIMNIDKFTEKLKANMPEFDGDEKEKIIKKALYIYVKLGKKKSFDEKYYFGNKETKEKIYRLAEKGDIRNELKGRKLICVSISRAYQEILKQFGIQSNVILENSYDNHVSLNINLGDGEYLNTDLQTELTRIQTKMELKHFGKGKEPEYRKLSKEQMLEYMLEVGYVENKEDLLDIEPMKKQIEGMNIEEKVDYILNDEHIQKRAKKLRNIEVKHFYDKVFEKLMPNEMNRKIYSIGCYREKNGKTEQEKVKKKYTRCIYVINKNNVSPYLYSKKEGRFIKCSLAEMDGFIQDGLHLGAMPNTENGVNLLKKEIKRDRMRRKNLNKDEKK